MEIDPRVIARIASLASGGRVLDALEWSIQPLIGGLGEAVGVSEGVVRIAGTGVDSGETVRWSVVRKRLRIADGHAEPNDWEYWRREALAYRAGLLGDLGNGVAAPVCYAVDDAGGDRVDLWLEDLVESGPAVWPLARYGLAGRHLGRFNGAYLAGLPIPTHPWLSPGRTRAWLALGEAGIANLDRLAAHPIGSAWLTADAVERTRRLWHDRERLLSGLDALPRCLCHHDAFRRNLIARVGPDGDERTFAIDWSGVGHGAVGEDLACLVAISLQFLDVDAAQQPEFDRIAFTGYVAGLHDAGATIDELRVRFGYAATASLLIGVGAAGLWLEWLVDDRAHVTAAESVIGHPLETILRQWRLMQPFLLDLGDEAHDILDTGIV